MLANVMPHPRGGHPILPRVDFAHSPVVLPGSFSSDGECAEVFGIMEEEERNDMMVLQLQAAAAGAAVHVMDWAAVSCGVPTCVEQGTATQACYEGLCS